MLVTMSTSTHVIITVYVIVAICIFNWLVAYKPKHHMTTTEFLSAFAVILVIWIAIFYLLARVK